MGNQDNGLTVLCQVTDCLEQPLDALGCQHGRGLIQNNKLRAFIQYLYDFNLLEKGYGEILRPFIKRNGKTILVCNLLNIFFGSLLVQESPCLFCLISHHQVFQHRKLGKQHEFLVHHPNPAPGGIIGVPEYLLAPLNDYFPFAGFINTGYHIHQRTFAGPIFPDDGVHGTLLNSQADVIVCHQLPKVL